MVFLGVAWLAPIPPKAGVLSDPVPKDGVEPVSLEDNARPSPELQPDKMTMAMKEHPAISNEAGSQSRSSAKPQPRQQPKGINGLWFLLLGLGILVAVSASVWHKHTRLQKQRLERQQAVEAQRKALQNSVEFISVGTIPAPAPASSAEPVQAPSAAP